jgi:hypothetical protein
MNSVLSVSSTSTTITSDLSILDFFPKKFKINFLPSKSFLKRTVQNVFYKS